jgi:hypothetical protein
LAPRTVRISGLGLSTISERFRITIPGEDASGDQGNTRFHTDPLFRRIAKSNQAVEKMEQNTFGANRLPSPVWDSERFPRLRRNVQVYPI